MTACNNKEVYSEFHSFGGSTWSKAEPAEFSVQINEASEPYTIFLTIRNNDDYPFQNLWLFVDRTHPNSTVVRDTVNIELADVYGKWHGKGLSLYSYPYPYLSDYLFPDTGSYHFKVQQGMRHETLPGVSDIGLTVSKQ